MVVDEEKEARRRHGSSSFGGENGTPILKSGRCFHMQSFLLTHAGMQQTTLASPDSLSDLKGANLGGSM